MTIETKFNIGDKVWVMNKNNVCSTHIYGIRVDCEPENSGFTYYSLEAKPLRKQVRYTLGYACDGFYDESELFPSKEELLKSL